MPWKQFNQLVWCGVIMPREGAFTLTIIAGGYLADFMMPHWYLRHEVRRDSYITVHLITSAYGARDISLP
jgi:hypothetical protein